MSFAHRGAFGKLEWTLDFTNYLRVFDSLYLKMVLRSVWLAFFTTASCLILGFPFSYLMARSSKTMRAWLLGLVIVPFWTNFVVRVYALRLTLGISGVLNQLLLKYGWIDSPLALMDNYTGLMIGMIYNYLPFMILPVYVTIQKFDFLLMDAAYDLGASRAKTFFKVLLPLCWPGIVTGALFVFIPAFGEFVIPDLLGGSQTMYVGNLITEAFLKSHHWPFGSALSMILVALSFVAFLVHLRHQDECS